MNFSTYRFLEEQYKEKEKQKTEDGTVGDLGAIPTGHKRNSDIDKEDDWDDKW